MPEADALRVEAREVRLMPLSQIRPYERNPRRNEGAVDKVIQSIRRYGWGRPIEVDANMVIINGHTRYKAARKLGLERVPVIVRDDLTPEEVKAYRIADNRAGDYATWDMDLLRAEATDLVAANFELQATLFSIEDLQPAGPPSDSRAAQDEGPVSFGITHTLVFDDEEQQQRFYDFMRALRVRYPEAPTAAARLDRFITEMGA